MTINLDTEYLYSYIPEYIQEWDLANANTDPNALPETQRGPLFTWLNGACSMLQSTDDWARDTEIGVGWNLLFNYDYYDSLTSATATQNDINRALAVLPWFAQFVGVQLYEIPYDVLDSNVGDFQQYAANILPYIKNWIASIKNANSFQRGTLNAFLTSLAVFLTGLNGQSTLIDTKVFTVVERERLVATPIPTYTPDPYYTLILVPSQYMPNNTYASVIAALASPGTYTTFSSTYSLYSNIPNSVASTQNYVNITGPGGLVFQIVRI
jgi:hypothetical protein